METTLKSKAEQQALNACELEIFRGFNLADTKRLLAEMLEHIGNNGMFSEYTKHNISHVDGMLVLLDFIIPESVQQVLTPTDWMMIVLSIYFHDLGMLITNSEFEERENNHEFKKYTSQNEHKYNGLEDGKRQRILFQDFVRDNHGKRIESILKNIAEKKSVETPIHKLLYNALVNVDSEFLKDLGMICKSHSEPLKNLPNQLTNKPYAQPKESEVNLLYAAAILRTADLMHITSERTPNTDFVIINPQNAYSKREWVKQRSVKQVRAKQEIGKEGKVDRTIQPHLFEVVGTFLDEDAYSHFMDYLAMAEQEIGVTCKLCKESSDKNSNGYIFPWDGISRESIKTEGFNAEKLRFELDKENILKLLVGHTLYNQANVALRELSQNAIDACRLMNHNSKTGSDDYQPYVRVEWDSQQRILKVFDNGTGMNEDIIKKYLLKVGSSRYQSPEFKKTYRSFHSISRFGIGLLTCFMISDDFDVITLWHEEDKAHRLKIKNMQGEYMLRNDVDPDEILEHIHGTTFILRVHDDVNFTDIVEDLKYWIIIPNCKFIVVVDGKEYNIGYGSANDAIYDFLENYNITPHNDQYKLIIKQNKDLGIEMHLLMKKHPLYKDTWMPYVSSNEMMDDTKSPIGICVEGIKVVSSTPGFNIKNYVAMVNCTGSKCPKTNVARDGLDKSENYKSLFEFIYNSYLEILFDSIDCLEKNFSQSWALKEIQRNIDKIARHGNYEDKDIFDDCLHAFECILIDSGNGYNKTSIKNLGEEVWTIESKAYTAAENLVQEIKDCNLTALALFKEVNDSFCKDERNILFNAAEQKYINEIFLSKYEVDKLDCFINERRIEFRWKRKNNRWFGFETALVRSYDSIGKYFYLCNDLQNIEKNVEEYDVIVSKYGMFCISDHPIFGLIKKLAHSNNSDERYISKFIAGYVKILNKDRRQYSAQHFENYCNGNDAYWNNDYWNSIDKSELIECLQKDIKFLDFNIYYYRNYF